MKKIFFLITIISLSSCALRERIPLGQIPMMPASEINNDYLLQKHVAEVADKLKINQSSILTSSDGVEKVQKSIDKILSANNFDTKYKAVVINNPNVNASTDGKLIYFNKGLLDKLYSQDHIDAIVSHELAHISCQHIKERQTTLRNRKILIDTIGAAAGIAVALGQQRSNPYTSYNSLNQSNQTTRLLVNKIGDSVFIKSFNREQELEADEVGLMMAAKAGTNPSKIIEFWQNAENILGKDYFNILNSTHPSYFDRKNNLLNALPIAEKYYNNNFTPTSQAYTEKKEIYNSNNLKKAGNDKTIERLIKLKKAKNLGILTEKEYITKKEHLLKDL